MKLEERGVLVVANDTSPADGVASESVRLLLVDDYEVLRLGLKSLLEEVPHFRVVGEASTAASGLDAARRLRPDVALVDLHLPDASGVDVCRQIRAEGLDIFVIMLTTANLDHVLASIVAGASGYLRKSTPRDKLVDAIETILRGGVVLDPVVAAILADWVRRRTLISIPDDPFGRLSSQERRVLALLAEGKTNRQIALELFLSPNTVKTHVASIFRKLKLSRRADVAALVARLGSDVLQANPVLD